MQSTAEALRIVVTAAGGRLRNITDEKSAFRPAPGKWSPREIVGHLIDSASNNHQRFVRAQFHDDLIFPGYRQDDWVSAQHYAEAPWNDLVELWRAYNLHLARIIELTPESVGNLPRPHHNLAEIAWKTPPEEPTLAWFMDDYVGHVRHHLGQIFPLDEIG
jgi:hypothetical protein